MLGVGLGSGKIVLISINVPSKDGLLPEPRNGIGFLPSITG